MIVVGNQVTATRGHFKGDVGTVVEIGHGGINMIVDINGHQIAMGVAKLKLVSK